MKTNVVLLIFLLCIGCYKKPVEEYNIQIIHPQFKYILKKFKADTKTYSNDTVKYVSLTINYKEDTLITLYANKTLNPRYYIGKALCDSTNVNVYSDKQEWNGFMEITKPIIPDKKAIKEYESQQPFCGLTYNHSYKYKKGRFVISE